jgi:hypothetical protein
MRKNGDYWNEGRKDATHRDLDIEIHLVNMHTEDELHAVLTMEAECAGWCQEVHEQERVPLDVASPAERGSFLFQLR